MISFDLMHWTLKRRAIQSQFDGNKETSKEPALNTSVYELKIDGLAEWNPINHIFFCSFLCTTKRPIRTQICLTFFMDVRIIRAIYFVSPESTEREKKNGYL